MLILYDVGRFQRLQGYSLNVIPYRFGQYLQITQIVWVFKYRDIQVTVWHYGEENGVVEFLIVIDTPQTLTDMLAFRKLGFVFTLRAHFLSSSDSFVWCFLVSGVCKITKKWKTFEKSIPKKITSKKLWSRT